MSSSKTATARADALANRGSVAPESSDAPVPEICLKLQDISKSFGGDAAVDGLTLDILQGEMFGLLGPSGCGKTTTLRMIAGLENPDQGAIMLGERYLVDPRSHRVVRPEKRDMGMVFQSYAVWPHMTVEENVAFPLQLRKVSKAETRRRVAQILDITGLGHLAQRPSSRLSGGQQQRVALARALVYEPSVLLLDEPLSNLDAALREQMRKEIQRLHRELKLTVIFVTHDQAEAMSLATRMAVMNRGRVEQLGRPMELYEAPATPFVRDFLGRTVMIPADLTRVGTGYVVAVGSATDATPMPIEARQVRLSSVTAESMPVWLVYRPEDITVLERDGSGAPGTRSPGAAHHAVEARVESATYLGDRIEYEVSIDGRASILYGPHERDYASRETLQLQLNSARASVWSRDEEESTWQPHS